MVSRVLHSFSIRSKILFLIGIPLLIIMGISGVVLYNLNKRASFDTTQTQEIMLVTSDLVRQLQEERGTTAHFLASDTTQVPATLKENREIVEERRAQMLALIEAADLSQLHENTRVFVKKAHHELEQLTAIRADVDARRLTASDAKEFYTLLNLHLLETALAFEVLVHDTELAERAMALTYLQMAKDAYKLQRSIGVVGYSLGWSADHSAQMTIAYLQSKERLRVFHELSDAESVALFDARLETKGYKAFDTARKAIKAGTPPENLNTQSWDKLASAAIDEVQAIEQQISAQLMEDFHAFDARNQQAFYQTLAGLSAVLALMLISAYLVARDITGSLKTVTTALEEIGAGDLDHEVSGKKRGDEIGSIARQAEILRGHAIKKRETDEALARASQEQQFVSNEIAVALNQVSNKALTYRLDKDFPEDFQSLQVDFNALAETLQDAMSTVREAALSVGENSQTIAANLDDLSRRTESQAAALERSSEAMDSITESVGQSAQSAKQAEGLSETTQNKVQDCENIVQQTVGAMEEIRTSSNEISQITKVIEDIAFQTNLLALNAGVEAARAGEAGRGFAVVASEVQRLAQRCSDAVSQIDEITARSSNQVKTGSRLVTSAGQAMADVSSQVREISHLVVSIAQGLESQSSQLSEVNHAVSDMERMTQNNVAMTEETSASASHLFQQSSDLNHMIGEFKLDAAETTQAHGAEPLDDWGMAEPASPYDDDVRVA